MENNLTDQETLGQFADALLAQKYPGQPTETLSGERDKIIKDLDNEIAMAIFGSLDENKIQEVNRLLDNGASEEELAKFFQEAGVNPEQKTADAFKAFSEKYLGGENE